MVGDVVVGGYCVLVVVVWVVECFVFDYVCCCGCLVEVDWFVIGLCLVVEFE